MNVIESNQKVLDDLQMAFKKNRKFIVFIQQTDGITTAGATTDSFTALALLHLLRHSIKNPTSKTTTHLDKMEKEG